VGRTPWSAADAHVGLSQVPYDTLLGTTLAIFLRLSLGRWSDFENPMFCSNCGKQIEDGARSCVFCGNQIGFASPTPGSFPASSTPLLPSDVPWFAVWLLNLILTALVFSLLLPASNDLRVLGSPFALFGWMFGPFWLLIQANFMRKLTGHRGPLILGSVAAGALSVACLVLAISSYLSSSNDYYFGPRSSVEGYATIALLASVPLYLTACFRLQSAMEEYYNAGLFSLGIDSRRTLAFGVIYLQSCFSFIRRGNITNQTGSL